MKTKEWAIKPKVHRYNHDIHVKRRVRRRLEHKWCKTSVKADYEKFLTQKMALLAEQTHKICDL